MYAFSNLFLLSTLKIKAGLEILVMQELSFPFKRRALAEACQVRVIDAKIRNFIGSRFDLRDQIAQILFG